MFLTVVITATFGTGLLVLWRSKLIVETEALDKLSYQTKLLANTFDQERLKLGYYTDSIESFLISIYPEEGLNAENLDTYKAQTLSYLESLASTISPFSLWLVFAPDIPMATHNIALYDREGDGNYALEPGYNLNEMDLSDPSMLWYTQAVEDGEVWTQPYYWPQWDRELISYSRALKIDGKTIGCIGSDFDFSQKRQEWTNTRVYKSGYIYLISDNYQFIYHPQYTGQNLKDLLGEPRRSEIIAKLSATRDGYLYYNFQGEDRVTSFVTLSNGWKLCVTTPKAQIIAGFRKMEWELLIIIVVITLLSIVLSTAFSHTITSPIHLLVNSLDKARRGNLDTRVEINSNDELQSLAEQFNYFMSELQSRINELHQKEIDLINAKDRAELSDRLKTSFLANLSHEIRTPLNGIIGNSEFLLDQDFTEEERREFVRVIEANIHRLLKFIDATLLFAQLEQNQIRPDIQDYPISWLQDDLSLVFEKIADSQQDGLQTKIIGKTTISEIDTVNTDPQLLRKITINLVENAFKFTRSGSVEMQFTLKSDSWGILIRDTGIGISPASQNRIFDKFFKDESDRSVLYEGLGLGLSITKALVDILKGKIECKSQPGKGSTFSVYFPINVNENLGKPYENNDTMVADEV